jgi:hypothetical protein
MSFNLKFFQGVTIQQVRDTMNYKQYMKTDEEVEGIRLTKEEQEKYTYPVLLEVIHHDERKQCESIQ